MTRTAARFVALAATALTLAACGSSGGGSPKSNAATTSAPPTGTSIAPGATPASTLAAKLRTSLAGLTSAHIDVDAGQLGGRSSGDFTYAHGVSKASTIVLDSGTDKTRIVTVGSTSYAMLPAGRNTSGKPWVRVSATSKNEFVRGLAGSLDLSKAAASLPAVADVVATASSVKHTGRRYDLIIDPSRSSGTTLGTLLGDIGQKAVPIRLTLDGQGRPVAVRISVTLGSQTFPVTVAASRFNAPVHVTAPPASQVAG